MPQAALIETVKFPMKVLTSAQPVEKIAKQIHLIYLPDNVEGIIRIKKGESFEYQFQNKKITNTETLLRIKKLVIPPAWKDVWVSPDEKGHLQATGIDALGRKQYRYHAAWSAFQSQRKFYRMIEFGNALPNIRSVLQSHLKQDGFALNKMLAAVVSIMEHTAIRVGNSSYEQLYGSFGLSTLKNKHVQLHNSTIRFVFRGKKGVQQDISITSKKLANIIKACKDLPGKELFQYIDADNVRHPIDSGHINNYIKEISGGDFSSKDFRTWTASVVFLKSYKEVKVDAEHPPKNTLNVILDKVATHLGNTKNVCKSHYVHPILLNLTEQEKLDKFLAEQIPAENGFKELEPTLLNILLKAK